jgi:hypothetical protein
MYPVGLIVNISSPKLQDWFAGWSKDRLVARIDKLQQRLNGLKRLDPGHPAFASILSACRVLSYQIGIATHLLIGTVFFVYRDIRPSSSSLSTESFFLGALLLNILFTLAVTASIRKRYRVFSTRYRARITEQIVTLEQKLRRSYIQPDQ